jgi:hypothetical protein
MIPQQHQPEQGDLDRLGLGIGRDHREGTLAHGGEHEGRGKDLGDGTGEGISQEGCIGPWNNLSGHKVHQSQGEKREGKSVEEPDLGRSDGSDGLGQAALGGVAAGLRGSGGQGHRNPEKGCGHIDLQTAPLLPLSCHGFR